MVLTSSYDSPLGTILLASDGQALTGLWFEGEKYFPKKIGNREPPDFEAPIFRAAANWLDRYFAGDRPDISLLLLDAEGSEFRKIVWRILCDIPYGQTVTYGEVAKLAAELMGKESMSSQAVGGAVGHNPLSIVIPCHRVVGANRSLTGYGGGLDRKLWLLNHEEADLSGFSLPDLPVAHTETLG